jgi:hypothetical protein
MDNKNKHIDDLVSQKANAHTADTHFAKMDFEAIKAKLPTAPAFDATPKAKPTNWFGLNTIVTTAGIVGAIGFATLWNKGTFSKTETEKTNIVSNDKSVVNDTLNTTVNTTDILENVAATPIQINDNSAKNYIDTNKTRVQTKGYVNAINKNVAYSINNAKENLIATQNFFSKLSNESQLFNINASKDTFIICKDGTALTIKANSFTTQNKAIIKGIIQLEIKEAYHFTDVIANGLHTVSNGNLLESAGMIYMNAKQNNQALDINIRQPIQITLSSLKNEKGMQLFYLDKNANDDLLNTKTNWIANEQQQNKNHSFFIRNLGWLNCSNFNKSNIEKTTIKIALQNETDSNAIRAVLVFPKMKSVINLYYKNGNLIQQNLPIGEEAYLVSFKITNGKTLSIIQKISISKDIIKADSFKNIPFAQVKAELDAKGSLQ